MSLKDANDMANSADSDQTTPFEAVWSESALFAQTSLFQCIELFRFWCHYLITKICVYMGALREK